MGLKSTIVIDTVRRTKTYVVTLHHGSQTGHLLRSQGWSCVCTYWENNQELEVLKKTENYDVFE